MTAGRTRFCGGYLISTRSRAVSHAARSALGRALLFTRAFDNGGASSISANGVGSQASEFTLDGVPDKAFGRQVACRTSASTIRQPRW